jgi:uncharacterized HAD superfamily protein
VYATSQSRLCDSQAGCCSYTATAATNQSSHRTHSFITGSHAKIAAAKSHENHDLPSSSVLVIDSHVNYLQIFPQIFATAPRHGTSG